VADGQTDRQTDRRTEFSSLYRVGITCSAVKILAAGSERAFHMNPDSWKCLIFIILLVINDKIRITKDGWP